jgi:hypothetical protein
MYVVVSNEGTSTYKLSYIICFKCFLLVGFAISAMGVFKQKFIKLVVIIVYA